jgi:hypothetical protein
MNKMIESFKSSLERTIWPFDPPLGYVAGPGEMEHRITEDKTLGSRKRLVHLRSIRVCVKKSELVRKLFYLYSRGGLGKKELSELSHEYDIHLRSRYDKILRCKFYIGIMEFEGAEYPHYYGNIIDEELFYRVQEILASRARSRKKDIPADFIFASMLRCGSCNGILSGYKRKGKYIYYRCSKHSLNIAELTIMSEIGFFFREVSLEDISDKNMYAVVRKSKGVIFCTHNIRPILWIFKRITVLEDKSINFETFINHDSEPFMGKIENFLG